MVDALEVQEMAEEINVHHLAVQDKIETILDVEEVETDKDASKAFNYVANFQFSELAIFILHISSFSSGLR